MQLLPADQLGVHVEPTAIRCGILLPGVSPANGCAVEVKIIHADDQFLQDIPATAFPLSHGTLPPWGDVWSASLPIGDPLFARTGRYVYRYRVTRQLSDGTQLQRDFLSELASPEVV